MCFNLINIFVTIYDNKNILVFLVFFFSNKVKTKVQRGFGFWTFLKMSIFEKPKKVLKKGVFFDICDENAHKL